MWAYQNSEQCAKHEKWTNKTKLRIEKNEVLNITNRKYLEIT